MVHLRLLSVLHRVAAGFILIEALNCGNLYKKLLLRLEKN